METPHATLVVYGPAFASYDFGPRHPLRPVRYELAMGLMESMGLMAAPGVTLAAPREATLSELLTVHSYSYVQAVYRAQRIARGLEPPADLSPFGLGTDDNPLFPSMYDASVAAVGASLQSMEALLAGLATHAFNMAGGLHHAHRNRAAGFCIFDDAAVAMNLALAGGWRVAYVDIDAHHADGVQALFYTEPRALTVSVHESGRYLFPGSGEATELGEGPGYGASINVPLPPGAGDQAYLAAYEQVVGPAVEAFAPDVIVLQAGCDAHWNDPLSHLETTIALYPELTDRLHQLAHSLCSGRLLVLGGGGYSFDDVTPRAWTALFAALIGQKPLPDALPDWWTSRTAATGRTAGSLLADPGPAHQPVGAGAIELLLHELRATALPSVAALRQTATPPLR